MKLNLSFGILTLLLFGLLLVACSAQQYVCPDGLLVDNPDACVKPKPAESPTYASTTYIIPTELSQLFAKKSKITSMSYTFQSGSGATQPRHKVFIKGNIMKIQFSVTPGVLYTKDVDTVVFNTATHTATGYCEQVDYCKKIGEFGLVDYETFYIQTPFDWSNKITTAENIGSEKLRVRNTILVKINDDYQYWVDSYYGVPIKVTKGNLEYYLFDNVAFNSVSDSDLQFERRN